MMTEDDRDYLKKKLAQRFELRLKADGGTSQCPLCASVVDLGQGYTVALIESETLVGWPCPTCATREASYLVGAAPSINSKFRQHQQGR